MVVGAGPRRYVAHLAAFCGNRGAPEFENWTGYHGSRIVDEATSHSWTAQAAYAPTSVTSRRSPDGCTSAAATCTDTPASSLRLGIC
jgi:hypothetical protein